MRLQWGRAREGPERPGHVTGSAQKASLQWGRAREGPESSPQIAEMVMSGQLQWGRAREGPESRLPSWSIGGLTRFNGAGPVRARRGLAALESAVATLAELQWGRAREGPERRFERRYSRAYFKLQWGRAREGPERDQSQGI